ncbi:MAG: hypothetical protein ACJAU6_002066 [Alphaproteobacteria bacterium]|jgi:hypothetical protein
MALTHAGTGMVSKILRLYKIIVSLSVIKAKTLEKTSPNCDAGPTKRSAL